MKIIVTCISLVLIFAGCSEKRVDNTVHFDQINSDDSTNYRYILRDTIEEEQERRSEQRRREF